MYISGAKFEEHCSDISGDILDWVLNCFSGRTYGVITFLIIYRNLIIFIYIIYTEIPVQHSWFKWRSVQNDRNK